MNITIANIGGEDITEETKARVEISNGETWDITVPPLDANETATFQYKWKTKDPGMHIWTVTVDVDGQIDEVVEENNVREFILNPSKDVEGTFYFAEGIWGFIAILSTTIAVTVIIRKRKK